MMNPHTLMRLWKAWGWPIRIDEKVRNVESMHILKVAGDSGCWPATIYRAQSLGYLTRPTMAHFRPTRRMLDEVRLAQQNAKTRLRRVV